MAWYSNAWSGIALLGMCEFEQWRCFGVLGVLVFGWVTFLGRISGAWAVFLRLDDAMIPQWRVVF